MFATFERTQSRIRLLQLEALEEAREEILQPTASELPAFEFKDLEDRFGKAGFLDKTERRAAMRLRVILFLLSPLVMILLLALKLQHPPSLSQLVFGSAFGLSVGVTAWLCYLRFKTKDFEREILFRLPLFLESLILVVESGMAVLPALEQVLRHKERLKKSDPVSRIFRMVYQLSSHGLPLEQSLEVVASHLHVRALRHVLLHLDISANVGGELIPALRSLSDHAHNEWRLSVEQRVRRLENLVVFPVFASVLGMIALTAAVPLVPLLNLQGTLQAKQQIPSPQFSKGEQP